MSPKLSKTPDTPEQENVERGTPESLDMDSIKKQARETEGSKIAPDEAVPITRINSENLSEIITRVAVDMKVDTYLALVAIYLLLLKGAANVKAPTSMEVKVLNEEGNPISLSKLDLMSAYRRVTGNTYLRRLAETLTVEISQYAKANNLRGELATRINNKLLSTGNPRLNDKEIAWASSFCQGLTNLAQLSTEKLPGLLAKDYTSRFSKAKGRNQPKQQSQGNRKAQKTAVKAKAKNINSEKK